MLIVTTTTIFNHCVNVSASDGASNPVIQNEAEKTGKSGEKRKLGILEIASEEFEDDSEVGLQL